jgi:hypothetical protein
MSAHQKKHTLDFKTKYGLGFGPQDDGIFVGFFCGGTPPSPMATLNWANDPWRAAAREAVAA